MNLDIMRSIEIEQNILGAMIIELNCALIVQNRGVKSRDFYLEKHKQLFTAISKVFNEHNRIDIVLLLEYINSKNLTSFVGGITYVTELVASIMNTTNIDKYVDILLEYSAKRDILELSNYIQQNEEKDLKILMDDIYNKVLHLFEISEHEPSPQENGEEFLHLLEQRAAGIEGSQGIETGLNTLDDIIGGFAKSELICIFAFSSVGKTTLAGQITLNMIRRNNKVLFFSLEMPARQLIERIVVNQCNIEGNRIRKGDIYEKEWECIMNCVGKICNGNRLIICSNTKLSEIIAKIQLEKLKNNVDIVFIDYVGLIQATEAERRDLTIATITQSLKALARKLEIPIVILAQAKQSVQVKNTAVYTINEKLGETDIAESASIFRDSDKVIGMYRNTELDDPIARKFAYEEGKLDYSSKDATVNPNCVNLLVKKFRNGTKATLAYLWEGQ